MGNFILMKLLFSSIFILFMLALSAQERGMPPSTPYPARGQVTVVPVTTRIPPVSATPTPKPITPTPTPTPTSTPIPEYSVLVFDVDPKCPPSVSTITLPTREKTDCLQKQASIALKSIILTNNIKPGKDSPCWPFFDQMYINCLDIAFNKNPGIGYGLSGHYISGLLYGQPWSGCAAGISGNPIRVSLAQSPREYPLIAWESANWWMWTTMDRKDLTDGDYISQATSKAMTACNLTNKTAPTFKYTFENLVLIR